jgi:hypothetical protein
MAGPFIVFGMETLLIRAPAPVRGRPIFSPPPQWRGLRQSSTGATGIFDNRLGLPSVAANGELPSILFTVQVQHSLRSGVDISRRKIKKLHKKARPTI